jgi:hypothetical protein
MRVFMGERIGWGWSTDVLAAWGQVAGAVASTGAVIVALVLAFGDRRRRRQEDVERQVSAVREVYIELNADLRTPNGRMLQYRVRNATESSISNIALVRVQAWKKDAASLGFYGEDTSQNEPLLIQRRLTPGETAKFDPVAFVWSQGGDSTLHADDIKGLPTIEFDDVAGRRWRRVGNRQPDRALPAGRLSRALGLAKLKRIARR